MLKYPGIDWESADRGVKMYENMLYMHVIKRYYWDNDKWSRWSTIRLAKKLELWGCVIVFRNPLKR
jgi:hypothetical protein